MRLPFLLVVAGLIAVTGCAETTPEEKARTYFLAGCLQGGTDRSVCECSYSKLTAKYPVDFFLIEEPGMIDPQIIEQFSRDAVKAALLCKEEGKK